MSKGVPGRFIAFEGLDGSGKSTQIGHLASKLRAKGIQVYETREPTDSPIGSLIHQIMTRRIRTDHKVIAPLFVADRLDHLLNEVDGMYHKVESGVTVLSDRYYFSSYAYQGMYLPLDWIIRANFLCAEVLRPSVNIFLDVEPEECLSRLAKDRWHLELYEDIDKMHRVKHKYLEAIEKLEGEEKILVLPGGGQPDRVADRVWREIGGLW